MKKLNLKALPLLDYVKGISHRRSHIETHSGEENGMHEPLHDRRINALAHALHPAIQHVRVSRVRIQSPDTRTYTLIPDTERGTHSLAYFAAGQYISVHLTIQGGRQTRPYSLSSSPRLSTEGAYEITVKRVDDGLVSPFILDTWQVGTTLDVSAPEGSFTYEPLRDAENIVGLAGGSGITPFVSLAAAIRDGDEDCSLTLLYGCRRQSDILFRAELDAVTAVCPRVRVVYVLSDEPLPPEGTGCFESGLLSAELIRRYAPEGDWSLFACGSQGMYRYLESQLPELGLPARRVRRELFGEYHLSADECALSAGADGGVKTFRMTVVLRGESRDVTIRSDESILRALERAGYAPPARCRSGSCGFCRSRLDSGEVYVPASADGRLMADLDHHIIHPCSTFPLSDLTVAISAGS